MMTTTTTTTTIRYPGVTDLDTGGASETSGYRLDLYLIPAGEREDGIAVVTTHGGVGNVGTPEGAWHNRWVRIGTVCGGTVGSSVLVALRHIERHLIEVSDAYRGARWDGNNHVGMWPAEESDPREHLWEAWDELSGELQSYWDAREWYGPAGVSWEDLAHEAGIDPVRALGDDWETVVEQVASIVEPLQDEPVTGTEDYARAVAERYREEHLAKDEDDDEGEDDDEAGE